MALPLTKCDEKKVLLRVENTEEILGGYNLISWHSDILGNYNPTNSSFVFSLGNKAFNYDQKFQIFLVNYLSK